MEKQGAPPSYTQSSAPGYPPQQQQHQPPYPLQQQQQPPQYSGQASAPQQSYTHQPYPNVVVQQPAVVGVANPPPDHMGSAIMVTLCCFWPTGIVAIMKANDAKNMWQRGDVQGAHASAASAKTMVNVSIIAGICSILFLVVFIGVYVGVVLKNINDNTY